MSNLNPHETRDLCEICGKEIETGMEENRCFKCDIDYDLIEDIELDGIEPKDHPDYSDAFVKSASYKGKPLTDDQLESLNEDRYLIHVLVLESRI